MMTDGKKHFCNRCPQHGRLLPLRKDTLRCTECGGETPDNWDLTAGLSHGDYEVAAQFARQLRETRRRQRRCKHERVIVSTRPWCSDCGLVLPKDDALVQAVRQRYPHILITDDDYQRPVRRRTDDNGYEEQSDPETTLDMWT